VKQLFFLTLALVHTMALATTFQVTNTESLREALDRAEDGDRVELADARYTGNFVVRHTLVLDGEKGATLDADGNGHALLIDAPDVTVRGLTILNWGSNLTDLDAGIFVAEAANNVLIEHNRLHGPGFGIWLDATEGARILSNRIEGVPAIRSQDRGNGIHLYAVSDTRVVDNEVWHTRDGIYIDTSNHNALINNRLYDLRYGVHYMYSHHNEVIGNQTRNTRTGYALMQSKYLTVTNNRSEGDQNYGILMNFITRSTLTGNVITDVRQGTNPTGGAAIAGAEGKALFVYNSVFNTLADNRFENSDLGVHLTAGSEDNEIYGNAFINNARQVKYVANREQRWAKDGRGNFWSDYLGWDRDNNGIGDTVYEPVDGVDKLLWRQPAAKLLLTSPAVSAVRMAQRQFPVFRSPGVSDPFPLMRPPTVHEGSHVPVRD